MQWPLVNKSLSVCMVHAGLMPFPDACVLFKQAQAIFTVEDYTRSSKSCLLLCHRT